MILIKADFVGNEQEFLRRSNNSVIDERTLHEIYIEPFRLQMKANPLVIVSHRSSFTPCPLLILRMCR